MDYQNGKIYRVVCEETQRVYIGSTCSTLIKRLYNHKNAKQTTCKDFINPKIFLIEDYPCDRKEQLLMRERYWMENTDCVNLVRAIRTDTERKEQHRENSSRYRLNNKELVLENNRQYWIDNKTIIAEKKTEKITCDCGSIISYGNLSTHKKTAKHNKFMHN